MVCTDPVPVWGECDQPKNVSDCQGNDSRSGDSNGPLQSNRHS